MEEIERKIADIHKMDAWHGHRSDLIGKTFVIEDYHASQAGGGYYYATGRLKTKLETGHNSTCFCAVRFDVPPDATLEGLGAAIAHVVALYNGIKNGGK